MNRYAYRTTGLAIKTLSALARAKVAIHEKEKIPQGQSIIFAINHFTRIETLFLPYHIYHLTEQTPVWSLADSALFKGALGDFLDKVGAVSTHDPDRDRLIVKSLLTGEANWIIFPEGRMVKSKKIFVKGRYIVTHADGQHPPHTGAATLALRTEFYRQRLQSLAEADDPEVTRLLTLFKIQELDPVLHRSTYIVPVNITYFPIRAQENALSRLARRMKGDLSERMQEEIMAEGTMLLSGVDVDIRFGAPIAIKPFLQQNLITRDIVTSRQFDFNDSISAKPLLREAAQNIMHTYMAAIYGMTTVNSEHLFASMLRSVPFKRIGIRELKQKVYLAASMNLRKMGLYTHRSLMENQLHLLVDDRFQRFENFLKVAQEKGIVKRQGRDLLKNRAQFKSGLHFHYARIENPIAVMANEVEPLPHLQRHIHKLAWQPSFWQRRIIARRLSQRAVKEYLEDYKAYFIKGESKDLDVGMPVFVRGRTRRIGILLIHGYMAAPLEVKTLALYLGRKGYCVYAPRLKGHGTSPEDLAQRTYHDWTASVDLGYALVRTLCRDVVVGGFSTGAGLALELAARVPDVAGVFAISPPMRLQDFSAKFVPAVDVWNKLMNMVHLGNAIKDFAENHPENPHINYFRNPISGIRELARLMADIDEKLPHIKVPALVTQSADDPVVDPRGSEHLFKRLGSANKEFRLFNLGRHGILLGEGSEKIHRTVGDFIDRLPAP